MYIYESHLPIEGSINVINMTVYEWNNVQVLTHLGRHFCNLCDWEPRSGGLAKT